MTSGVPVQGCMSRSVVGITKNVKYGQIEYFLQNIKSYKHEARSDRKTIFEECDGLLLPDKEQKLVSYT
jgi:hypothetical protein